MLNLRDEPKLQAKAERFRRGATSVAALTAALAIGAVADAARADPAPAANASATPAAPSHAVDADAAVQSTYTVDAVNAEIGSNPVERFIKYYGAEWGQAGPPADPNAPASTKPGWTAPPQSAPPMPFTDWPYGASTLLGNNRTASVDSPLMTAIAPTGLGKAMASAGIQAYGWVDVGGNVSTSSHKFGNAPAGYDFSPNSAQLDQVVLYVERTPDTVQTDHVDWGFRLSGIYGTDYRYTTAYGVASYQLLKDNKQFGYDFPMVYGEVYIPQVAEGLMIRVGRYISIPDIEAQLAPNNYMYSHSITYTFDNFTNTGIQGSLAVNKNVMLQLGLNAGTESALWHVGQKIANPDPNPLFPGTTMLKDPGARPSVSACARFQSNTGHDTAYFCADAINKGDWGYNNLQWYGFTYYHKFNDKFHVSFETYNLFENNVPNLNNPIAAAAIANGGTPFSPQYIAFNAPDAAQCKSATVLDCRSNVFAALTYWNYQPTPRDNVSLRVEWMDDTVGQRTGVATTYEDIGLGLQHWLSPQIELRPEVTYYWAGKPAFNGDAFAGIAPNKKTEAVLSGDIIFHF
jgi:Putative beta-barrel porin-2, OmpL-like. bbp2